MLDAEWMERTRESKWNEFQAERSNLGLVMKWFRNGRACYLIVADRA